MVDSDRKPKTAKHPKVNSRHASVTIGGRRAVVLAALPEEESLSQLTDAEREVALLAVGRASPIGTSPIVESAPCDTIARQLSSVYRKLGISSRTELASLNPDATGIVFAVPFAQTRVPRGRWHHTWTRLGVHIAASYRLRKKIAAGGPRSESRTDQADGVFEPGGSDLELRSAAVGERDALRHAVRTIDKARAKEARGGSGELLSVWHGLLHGRWSLFDQVESDGKRFVLVFENDPEAYGAHELTKRERQVATYAAQGHSNKMIGYELGIAPSTVAAHLKSALRRLGLRRRTDLVWIYGRTKE